MGSKKPRQRRKKRRSTSLDKVVKGDVLWHPDPEVNWRIRIEKVGLHDKVWYRQSKTDRRGSHYNSEPFVCYLSELRTLGWKKRI